MREVESLEASLALAERAAIASRQPACTASLEGPDDVNSRRAELDRREKVLLEFQRALEHHCMMVEQARHQLMQGKDSLKRAIQRFRAQAAARTRALDERSGRIDDARSQMMQERRELARQKILQKSSFRRSLQVKKPSAAVQSNACA